MRRLCGTGLYGTVERPSDCLSHPAACSGFAAERPTGRRYRSIEGAGAQQQWRRQDFVTGGK